MITIPILRALFIFTVYIWDVDGRIFKNIIEVTPTLFTTKYTARIKSKTCLLTPQPGPCRANIDMYYYDPDENSCNFTFKWGGCQGNGNRFDTIEKCQETCLSKKGDKNIPNFCSLRFDYGFCFGSVIRYYYDATWKVCKQTIYSGCGGNKNNFYSLDNCEHVCRFGLSAEYLATIGHPKETTGKKVLIVNPISTTTQQANMETTTKKCA